MASVTLHSDVVVLVESNGAQSSQSEERSTAQLPGTASLTWRVNPETEAAPLKRGRAGMGRTDTWPRVSQPGTSASWAVFAKQSRRPVGKGLITRRASLYWPTLSP